MEQRTVYEETDYWIGQIQHVDRLLRPPIMTLSAIAKESLAHGHGKERYVPAWVGRDCRGIPALLSHALVTSTLQRVHRLRRRFDAFGDLQVDESLVRELTESLFLSAPTKNLKYVEHLGSYLFGALNPLTASQVFWVLLQSGESSAHSGLGGLALFSMYWSLLLEYQDPSVRGAALAPWRPTASITSKCLFALQALFNALEWRATLYVKLAADLRKLKANAGNAVDERWRFAITLNQLSGHLENMASVAIVPDEFVEAARQIDKQAAALKCTESTGAVLKGTTERITQVVTQVGKANEAAVANAKPIVEGLLPGLINATTTDEGRKSLRENAVWIPESAPDPTYWNRVTAASEKATNILQKALSELVGTTEICAELSKKPTPLDTETVAQALEKLASCNRNIYDVLRSPLQPVASWTRRVLDRELVHASSGNETEFDASELVSAIAVVERWEQMPDIEIDYAIEQTLRDARRDGSWTTSQPIFLRDDALGVWPGTADIVWILASTVSARPQVRIADGALVRFVDWLARTTSNTSGKQRYQGWSPETHRDPTIVDLWTTASAVNALLAIRDIFEFRLWELCEKRFRVDPAGRGLDAVDPVDLGAVHRSRLHARLFDAARDTARGEPDANYSFILHGPPGSSKTALANALARECWPSSRHAQRLVRITPADFTIHGEDRLDAEARFIFKLLSHIRGATVLFDEIDDLLRLRQQTPTLAFIELVVPAMLNRLQDLRESASKQEICFLLATNYIERIEPALTRPGRIDALLAVPYPDAASREAIIRRIFGKKPNPHVALIVVKTGGWQWSSLRLLSTEFAADSNFSSLFKGEVGGRIEEFETDTTQHYQNPDRWNRRCLPLCNEFIHHTFAVSTQTPEEQIGELEKLGIKQPLKETLARVVAVEKR